ncbi:MAG: T9SS type A sorting domain-containing protein [Flavobacteriales bacterium]|nr:T9SS type A sorting domain-containing protein [Flavobacteriales bacterium]MEB2341531.1 T9SS type A sorting domain-containing protein [Flavobacteriia bacterium]
MTLHRTIWMFAAACLAARAFPMSVSISMSVPSFCGGATGVLTAYVDGGIPPYSYSWSNGDNGQVVYGLTPGTYTVTVTDGTGEEATGQETVISLSSYDGHSYDGPMTYCAGSEPWFVFYSGEGSPGSMHGPGPYAFTAGSYNVTPHGQRADACEWYSYYHVSIDAPPGASVTVTYTDGNGCPGTLSMQIPPPVEFPEMSVTNIVASCPNGAIGSAKVIVPATSDQQELVLRLKDASGNYVGGYCNRVGAGHNAASKTFTGLAPGDYEAVLDVDMYNQFESDPLMPACTASLPFTVPATAEPCVGSVSGTAYVDANSNCNMAAGENRVPGTLLEFDPGPYFAVTNSLGQYSLTLPSGNYSVTGQHPVLTQSCPLQFTFAGNQTGRNVAFGPGAPLDVKLSMSNGPARPGFELHYGLALDNLSPDTTGAVTLQMTFDPVLQYLGSSIPPASVAGNTITWAAPNLTMETAFAHKSLMVDFQVPPDVGLIGTQVSASATVATANTDVNVANNTVSFQHPVTGSIDPNDKFARTASGIPDLYFVDQDDEIDYTIRFQNTGTDTAFTVVVTDTLPAALDMATVRMGAYSHPFTWEVVDGHVLKFTFANILLPDSNVNEAASHGFVEFHVRPVLPLDLGTEIVNAANIYFDFNEAVVTDPCVLTAALSTQVAQVEGNPGIILVPNPATRELIVGIADPGFREGGLEVKALDGRTVLRGQAQAPKAALDVSGLCPGVYIVQLRDVRGGLYQARLVKQ